MIEEDANFTTDEEEKLERGGREERKDRERESRRRERERHRTRERQHQAHAPPPDVRTFLLLRTRPLRPRSLPRPPSADHFLLQPRPQTSSPPPIPLEPIAPARPSLLAAERPPEVKRPKLSPHTAEVQPPEPHRDRHTQGQTDTRRHKSSALCAISSAALLLCSALLLRSSHVICIHLPCSRQLG